MVSNYEILSKKEIHPSEILELIEKKDKELTYREEKIQEYIKKHIPLSYKQFLEAKKELEALEIPRIEEKHIIKILELMPKNGTEIRAITSQSGVVLVDEIITQILDILKKYI
jgi:DNA-directed RNA polymerase subunit F